MCKVWMNMNLANVTLHQHFQDSWNWNLMKTLFLKTQTSTLATQQNGITNLLFQPLVHASTCSPCLVGHGNAFSSVTVCPCLWNRRKLSLEAALATGVLSFPRKELGRSGFFFFLFFFSNLLFLQSGGTWDPRAVACQEWINFLHYGLGILVTIGAYSCLDLIWRAFFLG